jgi:UDP-N-acetylglucosamine--N-acetylmuramyl-(pentapeptide) pyrophosphoryl-undecaprenol N-acetylglucosamine transferase
LHNKTILIAAGGTGGHLYPALAVAEEIRRMVDHAKDHPEIKNIFVGTRDRIEAKEVPRAGFRFHPIDIHAPRKSFLSLLSFPWKFLKAIFDCLSLIRKEKPTAMLGAGAYLSVPVGIAAWLSHVPIALLEINSIPGSANKLLARIAKKLFLAYPESANRFSKRISETAIVCGTPVRAGLGNSQMTPKEARQTFGLDATRTTILVFGGSLGARAINEAMRECAASLASNGYNVLWQTGKSANKIELEEQFINQPNVRVAEYIYDMDEAYRAADLVVCRAGASSLAELAHLGKPAILIPYPFAAADHQEHNARSFERDGAAMVLRDNELQSKLAQTIFALLEEPERLNSMSKAMKHRDNPDAARVVAEWLISTPR